MGKIVGLNIFEYGFQTFGHPLVFVVNELFPNIDVYIHNIKIAELSRSGPFLCYKIGKIGDHIAFCEKMRNDIGPSDFKNRRNFQRLLGKLCVQNAAIALTAFGKNKGLVHNIRYSKVFLICIPGAGIYCRTCRRCHYRSVTHINGNPPDLGGHLTQLSLYSINLKIIGKANQSINVNQTDLLVSLRWVKEFAFHNPIITVSVVLIVLIALLYWFFGTEMGCSVRATGINQNMSRAQGINTNFNKVLGIMLSNGLVALSGAFLAQYQGFADVKMGQGAIVIGLAAMIIGEALFSKIFKNFALRLLSVAFGSIIYYIVIQAVITVGFDANLLKLLSAVIVAIFLAIPYWKRKYAQRYVKKPKGEQKNA